MDMLFGALAIGNIRYNVDHAPSLAVFAPSDHLPAARQPSDCSIGFQDSVLDRKPILPIGLLIEAFRPVPVVRMDRQPEFIILATEASTAVHEREPEQRHRFFGPGACARLQIRFPMNQAPCLQGRTEPRLAFGERLGPAFQVVLRLEKILFDPLAGTQNDNGILNGTGAKQLLFGFVRRHQRSPIISGAKAVPGTCARIFAKAVSRLVEVPSLKAIVSRMTLSYMESRFRSLGSPHAAMASISACGRRMLPIGSAGIE